MVMKWKHFNPKMYQKTITPSRSCPRKMEGEDWSHHKNSRTVSSYCLEMLGTKMKILKVIQWTYLGIASTKLTMFNSKVLKYIKLGHRSCESTVFMYIYLKLPWYWLIFLTLKPRASIWNHFYSIPRLKIPRNTTFGCSMLINNHFGGWNWYFWQ